MLRLPSFILVGLPLLATLAACSTGKTGAAPETVTPYEASVIATSGLVFRNGPSTSSGRIMLIQPGSVVRVISNATAPATVDGIRAPWMYCSFEGKKGWLFGGFLRRYETGKSKPAALAIDAAPGLVFAVFGRSVAAAETLLGKPASATATVLNNVNGVSTQHMFGWPGIRLGIREWPDNQTVEYLKLDGRADPRIAARFDIGKPVTCLTNLLNPKATSIRPGLVIRSQDRMVFRYYLTNDTIAGFEFVNWVD